MRRWSHGTQLKPPSCGDRLDQMDTAWNSKQPLMGTKWTSIDLVGKDAIEWSWWAGAMAQWLRALGQALGNLDSQHPLKKAKQGVCTPELVAKEVSRFREELYLMGDERD